MIKTIEMREILVAISRTLTQVKEIRGRKDRIGIRLSSKRYNYSR